MQGIIGKICLTAGLITGIAGIIAAMLMIRRVKKAPGAQNVEEALKALDRHLNICGALLMLCPILAVIGVLLNQ